MHCRGVIDTRPRTPVCERDRYSTSTVRVPAQGRPKTQPRPPIRRQLPPPRRLRRPRPTSSGQAGPNHPSGPLRHANRVPPHRRATLIAVPAGDHLLRFDIRIQGDNETVFFDL